MQSTDLAFLSPPSHRQRRLRPLSLYIAKLAPTSAPSWSPFLRPLLPPALTPPPDVELPPVRAIMEEAPQVLPPLPATLEPISRPSSTSTQGSAAHSHTQLSAQLPGITSLAAGAPATSSPTIRLVKQPDATSSRPSFESAEREGRHEERNWSGRRVGFTGSMDETSSIS